MSSAVAAQHVDSTPPHDGDLAIELDGVWVKFGKKNRDEVVAVHDLSLRIPNSGVFCLVGPNGSGKTTTINLICGLLEPTDGRVHVFGRRPTRERSEVLRRIAVVPQETALYDTLTGRENLQFHGNYYGVPRDRLKSRIDNALEIVQLTDRQNHRVGTYSGGMQRRLTLARALLTEPKALLLDEPTLGVDVQSRQALWDRVRELADSGISVLLTTNYMEEAEALADFITIIDHGKKVVDGTLDQLRAKVAQHKLLLHFGTVGAAESAARMFDNAKLTADASATTVEVPLSAPKEALRVIGRLRDEHTDLGESIEGFELKEPNLQDVFLQFTGRALRD